MARAFPLPSEASAINTTNARNRKTVPMPVVWAEIAEKSMRLAGTMNVPRSSANTEWDSK